MHLDQKVPPFILALSIVDRKVGSIDGLKNPDIVCSRAATKKCGVSNATCQAIGRPPAARRASPSGAPCSNHSSDNAGLGF